MGTRMDPVMQGARVSFATRDEGRAQISTSDYYSQNMSMFDRTAKTRRLGSVSEREYLENAASHVRAWTVDELEYVGSLIDAADRRMRELKLNIQLPDTVFLVKTDGWEEGGANGYTRENAIYLNQSSLSPDLLLHEIFHVVSRYNQLRIDCVYRTLGFRRCSDIVFDLDTRITNPDAPYLRHYLTVYVSGEPVEIALVMMASRPYAGGGFFGYVRKKLVALEGPDDAKVVSKIGGEPRLLDHRAPIDLYDRLGRNTAYNIHQEEVCAVHFEMLMTGARNLPHPQLVEALHRALAS